MAMDSLPSRLKIVRSEPDLRMAELSSSMQWDECAKAFGDDLPYALGIPALWRILSAPEAPAMFQRAPHKDDPQDVALAYWYPLVYMLKYSLGWARVDKGLWWWHQNGRPRDDVRLRVLADIYDADGTLDGFCAWLWSRGSGAPSSYGLEQFGWRDDGERVPADPQWIEKHLEIARASGNQWVGPMGLNSLHLPGHGYRPLEGRKGGFQHLYSDAKERRAIVLFDNMFGWYRGLNDVETFLPKLEGKSWYIEVIAKTFGWLGTYRRSRSTGLWFSGKHGIHAPGT